MACPGACVYVVEGVTCCGVRGGIHQNRCLEHQGASRHLFSACHTHQNGVYNMTGVFVHQCAFLWIHSPHHVHMCLYMRAIYIYVVKILQWHNSVIMVVEQHNDVLFVNGRAVVGHGKHTQVLWQCTVAQKWTLDHTKNIHRKSQCSCYRSLGMSASSRHHRSLAQFFQIYPPGPSEISVSTISRFWLMLLLLLRKK